MYKIIYKKDKYHLQVEMFDWCKQNISRHSDRLPYWSAEELWDNYQFTWAKIEQTFGTIEWWFRNEEDAAAFSFYWD